MISGSALWPIDRAGEAMEAVARASVWIGGSVHELPRYEGSDADSWIAECATTVRIECDPVVLRYGGLVESLRALGPSIVRVGDAFLAIVRTTSRHALAITPDGTKTRVPLRELAAIAGKSIEEQFAAQADRTLAFAAGHSRARALLIAELAGNAAVSGVWMLRAPIERAMPHAREGRIAGGIVAFGLSQLAQTLLLLFSWWILGAIAFGNASETGLFFLWLLVSLTMLPIRWFGSIAGRTAALQTATLLKRRLLAGGLKLEPDEVHGHGIGAFMAHVFESAAVENLGTHGLTVTVTAIATILGTIVTLGLGAGGYTHAALFVLWIAICGAGTAHYYLRRRGWTDARFALTGRVIENLSGHKTRLVQKIAAERNEAEDLLLSEYVSSETRLNRSALILDVGTRAWPWVGLLGICPLLVRGGYDPTAMALSVGGILLGTMALNLWTDGTVLFSAASIAWRRLSGYWKLASRPQAPGSPSARAAVDHPASPGIPLIEMSSAVFRHRNRERPTIDSASLTIAEGDRILLGGRSGAGKSTLSMLLSGGRTMQSGLLFFRGLDIASVGTSNWRRRAMLVPQFYANHIFSASLAYNLLLGRAWPASADDLAAAEAMCREIGLGPLLDRMPLGLDQPVGETGWQLSHGERTRVFLARALLQEPELMILDETFAALDPETLREVMSAVLARPGAVMVIAHV